jgi:uncharacterized RDD family membrane protein YckC
MNEEGQPVQTQDLFDSQVEYVTAPKGSRFVNFLIDNLFMNFALSYATEYFIFNILGKVAPDFLNSAASSEQSFDYILLLFFISYFNYILYYTICEKAFNGYTLGKIITGTKAVRIDGLPLTFKDALLRSLSRIVPFEAFSGLGDKPWHDSWTKTTVIKTR